MSVLFVRSLIVYSNVTYLELPKCASFSFSNDHQKYSLCVTIMTKLYSPID
jgi:hypothetical protein